MVLNVNMLYFWQIDVKLSVQYMSFSAHADAKGIMQLIRQVCLVNLVRQVPLPVGCSQSAHEVILFFLDLFHCLSAKYVILVLFILCRYNRQKKVASQLNFCIIFCLQRHCLKREKRLCQVFSHYNYFFAQAEPKNVVLVHGEAGKMDFLKQQIEKEFGKLKKALQQKWTIKFKVMMK